MSTKVVLISRTSGWASLVFAAIVAVPVAVHAHGEYPQAEWILVEDPGESAPQTVIVSATFGLVITEDGGSTWDWVCPVAANPVGAFIDGRALLFPDRTIVLGLSSGLARGPRYGCGLVDEQRPLGATSVTDLSYVRGQPDHALALTFEQDASTGVYRSTDRGQSWERTSTQPPFELLGQGLRVAPSDAARVYVSGRYLQEAAMVYRSTTAGASWERYDFEAPADEFAFTVLGIDPGNANRLYILARGEVTDRIIRSDDGGESFRDVATLEAPPLNRGRHFGFTFDAEGRAWFGNTLAGLWREEVDGAALVNADTSIACLHFQGDELWACADGLTDGFAVGRSSDGGETFSPLLRFADIANIRSCSEDPAVAEVCEPYWNVLQVQLGLEDPSILDADGGPVFAVDASAYDAGPGDAGVDAGMGGGGSGCAVGAPRPPAHPVWMLLIGWLLWGCRRAGRIAEKARPGTR